MNYNLLLLLFYISIAMESVKNTMHEHMKQVRANAKFKKSMIFLYIEANMSWLTSDDYSLELEKHYKPLTIVRQDPKKAPEGTLPRAGVITTRAEKERYVSHLQHLLSMGNLRISKDLISQQPNGIVDKFIQQLNEFKRTVTPPKNPNSDRYEITIGGKGIDSKDDLVFAVMIGCVFAMVRRQTLEYRALKNAFGWPN